jgi:hypothetical protein
MWATRPVFSILATIWVKGSQAQPTRNLYKCGMHFWTGTGILRYENFEQVKPIRIFLDVDLDLKIEITENLGFAGLLLAQRDDLTLEVQGVNQPIKLLMSHMSASSSGAGTVVFAPMRSPIWMSQAAKLKRGRAALVNFGGWEPRQLTSTHVSLEASGWVVKLLPVDEKSLCYPPAAQSDEHRVTHHLEFERADGSSFSDEAMTHFMEKLVDFFSFCHGGWVAIAFAVGIDERGVVMAEEWGVGRVGVQDQPNGFLDRYDVESLINLYPLFMTRVEDEGWADAIGQVVYWLRRANIDNSGPDGGIILLQATLERFAWHLLVREREALSEKGFADLTAADQMRLMISTLNLPKDVPDGLIELRKFAKHYGLDAAESFTRIRNRIVHPPKLKAMKELFPYYDAYRLGRWYAELAVLAACGYRGKYSNRTRSQQWVGQVERVPWAPNG